MISKITGLLTLILTFSSLVLCGDRFVTLDDIKKYVLNHNFDLKIIDQEIKIIEQKKQEINSRFMPRFGIAGGQETRFSESTNVTDPLFYVYSNLNLFNGFADQYDYDVSKIDQLSTESKKNRSRYELELEVEKIFYTYIIKKRLSDLHKSSLDTNNKHKKMILLKRSSGLASQADELEFDLRESEIQSEISTLEQEMSEARFNLARIMGAELGVQIEPSGDLPHYHLMYELSEYLRMIRRYNETVKIAALEQKLSQVRINSARSEWLPKIDLELRYGRLSNDEGKDSGNNDIYALMLAKWEFFSGLQTKAKVSQAVEERLKSEYNLQRTILKEMTEVEVKFSKLQKIQERIHLESGNEVKVKKYYSTVLNEYKRGIKNGSDLKGAEEKMLELNKRKEELKYEFIIDKLDLEKAIGNRVSVEVHDS